MRNVISPQLLIGQTDIADIVFDATSRDDIPMLLLGLQHIYTTKPLRKAVFTILEEVIPLKTGADTAPGLRWMQTKGGLVWINGVFWYWEPYA